jgi:hypothetical protein
MHHFTNCSSCGTVNSRHRHICSNCKAYLRERIVNIDLWDTVLGLLESPVKTYNNIIFAENKNFLILFLLFITLKLIIISKFISILTLYRETTISSFILLALSILTILLIIISLFSWLLQIILKKKHIDIRFKDNFSIITFSLFPLIASLFFLFPFEIMLYGDYLFLLSPSPFDIKPLPAYIFFSLEILFILYSMVHTYLAIYTQSLSKIFPIFFTLLFYLSLYYPLYLFSYYLYN